MTDWYFAGFERKPFPVGTAVPSWTPASLSGLVAWYKSDTQIYQDLGTTPCTVDADPVRQWNDLSGNGYNLTNPGGTQRPLFKTGILNSKPAVRYDGSLTILLTGAASVSLGGTTATLYVVGMASAASSGNGRFSSYLANGLGNDYDNAGSAILLNHNSSSNIVEAYRNGQLSNGAVTDGSYYQLFSVYDGANNTVYIDSSAQTPVANSDTFAATGCISIGCYCVSANPAAPNVSSIIDGDILEVVITNTASGADRTNMASYFTARYGI